MADKDEVKGDESQLAVIILKSGMVLSKEDIREKHLVTDPECDWCHKSLYEPIEAIWHEKWQKGCRRFLIECPHCGNHNGVEPLLSIVFGIRRVAGR